MLIRGVELNYRHTASASGLVVKFNVAIVEPSVRFRACAFYILVFQHFLIFQRHPHKLYHRKAITINHGWKVIGLRYGSAVQKVYWTNQGSNVCFHTCVGRYLFSCANSVTFFSVTKPEGLQQIIPPCNEWAKGGRRRTAGGGRMLSGLVAYKVYPQYRTRYSNNIRQAGQGHLHLPCSYARSNVPRSSHLGHGTEYTRLRLIRRKDGSNHSAGCFSLAFPCL